jgi:hypothetical protein
MRALSCVLVALVACDAPASATLVVNLQRLDIATSCWRHVSDSGAAAVHRDDFCNDDDTRAKSATLAGGVDRLRLLIDYEGVDFEDSATVSAPTIEADYDGVPLAIVFHAMSRPNAGKLAVLAEFDAPPRAAAVIGFTVTAAPGLVQSLPAAGETLAATAPALAVVATCPTAGCIGGVGMVPVDVSLAAHDGGDATLTWTLDGIAQPESRTVTLAAHAETVSGRAFVPVPVSTKPWIISARFGDLVGAASAIALAAPMPSMSLFGCSVPCKVKAGSVQTLVIDAPGEIQTPSATVSTFVDAAASLVDVAVPLDTKDVGNDLVEGVHQLTVPDNAGSTWKLDAIVGGFRAPSLTVDIKP